ncbi:CopG family transcriptional regulator [Leptospira wolffii]|uniref:ribbon-helix-helix domain-containing protein n=1 Tax=Leptospira wolffii TaxID=409998 RepID=UPI000309C21E|nr:CopG family transcriptional regulator [Leptospira wolffii]EPG66967.1 hypothetical protein LEP1GSC061_1764 [Leptospira wolffii serovar Khorat str. Khorat-H2]
MRKVVSVSLDTDLDSLLVRFSVQENISKSEVIQKALRQYFFLSEAKRLRGKAKQYAEKAGYLSEEDYL